MLEIKNLSVSYDNKIAVDKLSAQFSPGKISGLIGPNGAGKSTLIKTCVGIISSYSGEILFDGRQAGRHRYWVKENAAYAPENAELLPYLSGLEFLNLIAKIHQLPEAGRKINFYLELLDLSGKRDELIKSYSHGMKQKLAVASVLLTNSKFIFLDESLNGLDSISLAKIFDHLKELKKQGRLILITSHNVQLIHQWCDEVMVIDNGKISASFNKKELAEYGKSSDGFLNKYMEIIYK